MMVQLMQRADIEPHGIDEKQLVALRQCRTCHPQHNHAMDLSDSDSDATFCEEGESYLQENGEDEINRYICGTCGVLRDEAWERNMSECLC